MLLNVAALRRPTLNAMVASGIFRDVLDAFINAGAGDPLLLKTAEVIARVLLGGVASWIPEDVKLYACPGVDRDCREALAAFLLLPANYDVMRRLLRLIMADEAGASGARGYDCAAFQAWRVLAATWGPERMQAELAQA